MNKHGWMGPAVGLVGLTVSLGVANVEGQPMHDPTRPPPPQASLPAAQAPPRMVIAQPQPAPTLPPPQIQALKLSQHGPAMALVDGLWLGVGDLVQDRRVLAIDPDGLLLQGRTATERVPMLAGSPKQLPGSILVSRSTAYAAPAEDKAGATGLADAGPGMPASGRAGAPGPSRAPGHEPGQTPSKEQAMSVAGRTSR